MKGVVLAGGTGSRLHPLTRITNKHLLPVHDKPMVLWAIDALHEAGVKELMLVTGGEHVEDFRRLLGAELECGSRTCARQSISGISACRGSSTGGSRRSSRSRPSRRGDSRSPVSIATSRASST